MLPYLSQDHPCPFILSTHPWWTRCTLTTHRLRSCCPLLKTCCAKKHKKTRCFTMSPAYYVKLSTIATCQKVKTQTVDHQRLNVKPFVIDFCPQLRKSWRTSGESFACKCVLKKKTNPYRPRPCIVLRIPIGCEGCKMPRNWRIDLLIPPTSV